MPFAVAAKVTELPTLVLVLLGCSVKTGGETTVSTATLLVTEPPEPDTHIAIFDTPAGDAKSAVEAAWAAYKPGAKRPLKLVTPRPGREGWDERQVFEYETSPNERAVVQALAAKEYKLTLDEFRHIVSTFPLIPKAERAAALDEFTRIT